MTLKLPRNIDQFIGGAVLVADAIGESPCSVYSFKRGSDRFFLKMCPAIFLPTTYSVLREAQVLSWLAGRLSVPDVVAVAQNLDGDFMITRGVEGQPLQTRINDPSSIVSFFCEAVRQLQAVPFHDCPFDSGVEARLKELDYLLAHKLGEDCYNLEQWPDLHTPNDLVSHLYKTKPTEDLMFSHGDLCGANVFVDAHDTLHFIDMGRGGIADRWLDIAFVHRFLRKDVSKGSASQFLAQLGEGDHPAKREFFEQLDEFF